MKWISVEDRLPPTRETFIAGWLIDGEWETIDWLGFDGRLYWNSNSSNESEPPTHWMPLPDPPNKKGLPSE